MHGRRTGGFADHISNSGEADTTTMFTQVPAADNLADDEDDDEDDEDDLEEMNGLIDFVSSCS